ncbi:MAG: hypothetical protein K6G34_01705 [Lachnospiraceae bacterium]|nr:hypothetical protein [Lachnospiraceae bacterium]
MEKKKIPVLIICAVLAASLAGCAFFGAKTPAEGENGGIAEETTVSTEVTTQDKMDKIPQSSTEGQGKVPQRSDEVSQKWSGQKIEAEVHYLLDSDAVLDEDHKLKKEIRSEFSTGKKIKTFGVIYFDGMDRAFEREGWINRIRMQEGKADKGFELTYKKRYPIAGIDVDEAVRRAEEEGFDLSGENWKVQVDWGFSSMTLSISLKEDVDADGRESVADLTFDEGRSMLEQHMPVEERDWGTVQWGNEALESAQMAGPVFFDRYNGKFEGSKVQIEVWEIPEPEFGESLFITEISLTAEDCEAAAGVREELGERLKELGILTEENSLKTQKVLDAFL